MSTDSPMVDSDASRDLVDELISDITRLEDKVEQLEAELDRVDHLEDRMAELDARTDMLQLIEETDQMEPEQRSVTLVQHLHRKATRKHKRGRKASAIIDAGGAQDALHYPDLDRTTFYADMERAGRLVGDRLGAGCCYSSDRVKPCIRKFVGSSGTNPVELLKCITHPYIRCMRPTHLIHSGYNCTLRDVCFRRTWALGFIGTRSTSWAEYIRMVRICGSRQSQLSSTFVRRHSSSKTGNSE